MVFGVLVIVVVFGVVVVVVEVVVLIVFDEAREHRCSVRVCRHGRDMKS